MHPKEPKTGGRLLQRIGVRLGLAEDTTSPEEPATLDKLSRFTSMNLKGSEAGQFASNSKPKPDPMDAAELRFGERRFEPEFEPAAHNARSSATVSDSPSETADEQPLFEQPSEDLETSYQALGRLLEIMDQPAAGATGRQRIREARDLAKLTGAVGTAGEASGRSGSDLKPRRSRSVPVYDVLARRTITLLGWDQDGEDDVKRALAGQRSKLRSQQLDPLNASATVEPQDCDVIILAAPAQWELMEPIEPGFLARTRRPVLLTGSPRLLLRLAQIPQPGLRAYVSQPFSKAELAWRTALLLSQPTPPERPAGTRTRRAKPEILIADDDPTTRTLISTLLTRQGMVCHTAENGGEALEIFKAKKPCAAILDILMPCMDGFQVLAAVKQDPDLRDIPVLLLTSRTAEVDKLQAFALGADDYLVKPFSPMELAVRLKRLWKQNA